MKQSDVCRGRTADIRKGTGIDMDQLKKANEYVKQNRIPKEELPVFHVTPPCGWMNDPNGFSVYQGKTHLFYQFHPYSTVWGPMHWGHYETEDFVKWTELPAALAPDQAYDEAGCFSGSGIETEKGHLLVYTGVMEKEEDGQKYTYQNQCIALGDGKAYNKLAQNPVVTGDMLPKGFSREHFRDPKIWKEDDGYYMVVGNKTDQGKPQVVLFHSENAVEWEYVSVLAEDKNGNLGTMWECPDFFELDGKYVLLTSPQDMLPEGLEFHNGNGTLCIIGELDPETHTLKEQFCQGVDYGIDYYAMQTLLAPDGRRIMIAWMQNWDTLAYRCNDSGWFAQMSLPRELSVKNGRLYQVPIRELNAMRANKVEYNNVVIKDTRLTLDQIEGRTVDLELVIRPADKDNLYKKFELCFAENEKYHSTLCFRPDESVLKIDRKFSGSERALVHQSSCLVNGDSNELKLRVILDKFSVEVFINDGEQVMSAVILTKQEAKGISFFADGAVKLDIVKYDLL